MRIVRPLVPVNVQACCSDGAGCIRQAQVVINARCVFTQGTATAKIEIGVRDRRHTRWNEGRIDGACSDRRERLACDP